MVAVGVLVGVAVLVAVGAAVDVTVGVAKDASETSPPPPQEAMDSKPATLPQPKTLFSRV